MTHRLRTSICETLLSWDLLISKSQKSSLAFTGALCTRALLVGPCGMVVCLCKKLRSLVWTKNDHLSSRFLRPTFRDEEGFLHKYACHNCRKKIECEVFQDHSVQRCLAFLWSTWNFLLRLWPTYLPLRPKDIDTLDNGIRFGSELDRRTQNEDHRSNIYQYVALLSLCLHDIF